MEIEISIKTGENVHKRTFQILENAIHFIENDAVAILKDQAK